MEIVPTRRAIDAIARTKVEMLPTAVQNLLALHSLKAYVLHDEGRWSYYICSVRQQPLQTFDVFTNRAVVVGHEGRLIPQLDHWAKCVGIWEQTYGVHRRV